MLTRRVSFVVLMACLLSGCKVGRSWFHMDSTSYMPFFGIDLLPRRDTTLNVEPQMDDLSPAADDGTAAIRPASDKRVKPVHLPRISALMGGLEDSEEIPVAVDRSRAE